MENASKALLIAGAVLICILLISVGISIFRKSKDVTDQVNEVTSGMSRTAENKAQNIQEILDNV